MLLQAKCYYFGCLQGHQQFPLLIPSQYSINILLNTHKYNYLKNNCHINKNKASLCTCTTIDQFQI